MIIRRFLNKNYGEAFSGIIVCSIRLSSQILGNYIFPPSFQRRILYLSRHNFHICLRDSQSLLKFHSITFIIFSQSLLKDQVLKNNIEPIPKFVRLVVYSFLDIKETIRISSVSKKEHEFIS